MEQPTRSRRSVLGWVEERVSLTEIVSFLSVFGLLPTELDTTKPLKEALAESLRRPLPSYARWPHVLGILSFMLFLFLGVTGALLAFYYQPTAAEAYLSTTAIARDVSMGALVGQAHHWAAILFLAVLLLRILRFYFGALYGKGREIVWMVAILTFVAAANADLTGRLLPWDTRGYWSMVRAREVTDALPGFGPLATFLVGGAGLDSLILTRFYVLHMFVLPAILLVMFYVHFSSVRRVGLSFAVTASRPRPLRVALYDVLLLIVGLFGGLITLSVLWPQPFMSAADPLVTPHGARPPWYLLAPHAVQQVFPGTVPMVVRGLLIEAVFAVILLLPFLVKGDVTGSRRGRFAGVGLAACAAWVGLTALGWWLEVYR